ncbi:uncharacterized protein LOC120336314 isoform X3 [Styela clava]
MQQLMAVLHEINQNEYKKMKYNNKIMSKFCGCDPIKSKKTQNHDCQNIVEFELADKEGQKWISNNGKGRYFSMLLQPDRGLFLRAEKTTNRYLYNNEGKLEMVTTASPTFAMHWFLSPSFEMIDLKIATFMIQIHQVYSSQKWVSVGAKLNDPIQTQQLSGDQDWTVNWTDDGKFQFATPTLKANDALKFGTVAANFKLNSYGGGVSLQCTANSQYVVVPDDNGELGFSVTEAGSASWDLEIMGIILQRDGKIIIIPEFPIQNPEK